MKILSYFLWQFHPYRVCLYHHNWQSFSFTPWLPYSWKVQWIYLVYRWFMALFFFGWIFTIGMDPLNGDEKFFIFLTNWGYLAWVGNLIWAAISTTITFLCYFCFCPNRFQDKFDELENGRHSNELVLDEKPEGCCGHENSIISWHQKIHWVLYNIGTVVAIAVTTLYWGLLYDPNRTDIDVTTASNILTHGVNGLVALFDVFFTGIPFNLLHVIYPTIFAGSYAGFTGIYHAFNGTNTFGNPYVYPLIDYNENPGSAAGIALSVVFIYVPFLYVILYFLYLIREGLIYVVRRFCCGRCFLADDDKTGSRFEMLQR